MRLALSHLLLSRRGTVSAQPLLVRLGSARLALWLLALLGVGVAAAYAFEWARPWGVVVPLAAASVNLCCAILSNAAFQRQPFLLAFHVALLALIVLAAFGRLTYLKGTLELAEGEEFSGALASVEAGPWHRSRLDEVSFVNAGFRVFYHAGVRRAKTENLVRYRDAQGGEQSKLIGDHHPLVLADYRFYTSFNKGFAPVFLWQPRAESPVYGAVHLPAYPLHEYRQASEWRPPGSNLTLWTMLRIDEVVLDPTRSTELRLPRQHTLVVRSGATRAELAPGERIDFPAGSLTYVGLKTWMGYTVAHDSTLPWLFAAALAAVLSLAGHFALKFSRRAWDA